MSVVLRVEGLTKCYGSIVAVDGVSAEIGEGELVSFVGPSGCGKTTLLRMIGGFIRADAGRVVLDGHDVTDEPPNRRSTAMVFQSYALFPHLSVADNVGYALRVHRRARPEIGGRRSCSGWSSWRGSALVGPTSFPAASSSGWLWPGHSRLARGCCCSTSPSRTWTPTCGSSCARRSHGSRRTSG